MPAPPISAVVVNYRRPDILAPCLTSLRTALDHVSTDNELIVVDNASGDESCATVRKVACRARLIELPENRGFGAGVSEGLRHAAGEWLLLINNDVVVSPGAVDAMLAAGRSAPDVGSVAAQMRFANGNGTLNSAGIVVDRLGIAVDRLLGEHFSASETAPCEVFGASNGAALLRRVMLNEIGGIDGTFFFCLDDADIAWRAQMAGWRCLYAPRAVVYHHHGATGRHGSSLKHFHVGLNRVRMLAKNADSSQLRRYGLAMLGYDLAYVAFVAVTDRTLAPLRGRLQGLREWRRYRRAGRARRPVDLAPTRGLRAALSRRAAWLANSSANVRSRGHGATS